MKHRVKFKRRILVDPMQYRLMAVGVFHSLLIVVVFAVALFAPLMIQIGTSDEYNEEVLAAAHQFMTLHSRVWPPLLCTLVILMLHSVLVSHKVAGPLYRLRHEFKLIGGGDIGRVIRIRKRDYLHKEAEALNAMLASLRARVERIDRGCRDASAALVRVHRAVDNDDRVEFDTAIAEARASLADAGESLSEFDLGPRKKRAVTEKPQPATKPTA